MNVSLFTVFVNPRLRSRQSFLGIGYRRKDFIIEVDQIDRRKGLARPGLAEEFRTGWERPSPSAPGTLPGERPRATFRFFGCAHEDGETAAVCNAPYAAGKCRPRSAFGPSPSRGHRLCAEGRRSREVRPRWSLEHQRLSSANPFYPACAL